MNSKSREGIEQKRAVMIKEIMKRKKFKKGIKLQELFLIIRTHSQFDDLYENAIKNNLKQFQDSTRRLLQEDAPNMKNFKGKNKDFWCIKRGLWTYYNNPYFSDIIRTQEDINKKITFIEENSNLNMEDKKALVKIRINQSKFREMLLSEMKNYKLGSPFKNIFKEDVLIASHIVDYADCNEKWEQGIFHNGLILSPDVDKLFDRKYISFNDKNGKIIIKNIDQDTFKKMGIDETMELPKHFLTEDRKEFLKIRNKKYGFIN